jgi:hypothetical protein
MIPTFNIIWPSRPAVVFYCSLIWSDDALLEFIIRMWWPERKLFEVWGNDLQITNDIDIYFINGLPFLGIELPTQPRIPPGVTVAVMVGCHYLGNMVVSGGSIDIYVIKSVDM